MSHIAIFLPSLRGGGAQRVAIDIANGLVMRGFQVDLILANNKGVYHSLLNDQIKVVNFDVKHVYQSVKSLKRYLHISKPDTLLAIQRHAVVSAFVAKLFSTWSGKIVARETNSFVKIEGKDELLRDRLLSIIVKYIYRYMDYVIAPSLGVASELKNLSNVKVIPNPIVIPFNEEKLRYERPFILAAGTLDNQKRFNDLLVAFSKLIKFKGSPIVDLIILGEGKERKNLLDMASDLEISQQLFLVGFVSDPFKYMREASVFVLSSAWEGLPNVLIQAMACGAPIVATDCPHGPREILASGKYGELVPVSDTDAMANAILRQLRYGRRSYPSEALAPYSYKTVIDSYQQILT